MYPMRNFALGFISALVLMFLSFQPTIVGKSVVLNYDSSLRQIIDQVNFLSSNSDCPDCNCTCPEPPPCPEPPECNCTESEYIYYSDFNDTNRTLAEWEPENAILIVKNSELNCSFRDGGERIAHKKLFLEEDEWYEIRTKVSAVVSNKARLAVSQTPDTYINAPYKWGWQDGFNPSDSNTTVFRFKATGDVMYVMFGDEASASTTYTVLDYLSVKKASFCPEPPPCLCDGNTSEFAYYTEKYHWDRDKATGRVTVVYNGKEIVKDYSGVGDWNVTVIDHVDDHVYFRGPMARCYGDYEGYEVRREIHDSFHKHCCADPATEAECLAQGQGIPYSECTSD